jgi:hypothetical protein
MGAAGSGNTGSSMLGRAYEGAMGDYMDRAFDTSMAFRGNQWNQGLNMENAINQYNANSAMNQRGMGMNAAGAYGGMAQGFMPQMMNMSANVYNPQLMAGGMQQQNQQANLDAMMNNYYMQQQMPFTQGNMGMQSLLPAATAFGTTTGTGTGSNNMTGQVIGQLGAAWLGSS